MRFSQQILGTQRLRKDLLPHEWQLLEAYYDSGNLRGLFRTSLTLLRARLVQPRDRQLSRIGLRIAGYYILFVIVVGIPALLLTSFQRLRAATTGQPWTFDEGSWQFYLHLGLREDLAHHTNETTGYHTSRPDDATEVDDLATWIMTLAQFVWSYDDLMGIVWDEASSLRLLQKAAYEGGLLNDPLFHRLGRQWELERPYDAPLNGTYADVRRDAFEQFVNERLEALPRTLLRQFETAFNEEKKARRAVYQRLLSISGYMQPSRVNDEKAFISLSNASIGVIHGGRYHLIRIASRDEYGRLQAFGRGGRGFPLVEYNNKLYTADGIEVELRSHQVHVAATGEWLGFLELASTVEIKAQVHTLLSSGQETEFSFDKNEQVDILLAETPRSKQRRLRAMLPVATQHALKELQHTPVLLNWDLHSRDKTLAEVRRTRRGIGDHPLTVIRTEDSFIFDEHHAFFDGTWAVAMAEVLTKSAIQWCSRVKSIGITDAMHRPQPIQLHASPDFIRAATPMRQMTEVSAEAVIPGIQSVLDLRKRLRAQGTSLTVNDLLVIARMFHAAHYRPSPRLEEQINTIAQSSNKQDRKLTVAINESLERGRLINPALLIPVDATLVEPKQRIYPLTFRSLSDELVWSWDDTWDAYQAYRKIEPPTTTEGYYAFHHFQTNFEQLLQTLQVFSHIFAASKSVATRGKSINEATLKLLANLPPELQHILRYIPERFSVLSEIMRGDEVYSNIGRVAQGATLRRFMSAKDDGNSKALVWGIMTDADGRMVVTMRDFRPHVGPLVENGQIDLARSLAQDYVNAYTTDLISLVAKLSAMLQVKTPQPV